MTAPSPFKQADVVRILKAAKSAGYTPYSVTVQPGTGDITLSLDPNTSASKKNAFDEILSKSE